MSRTAPRKSPRTGSMLALLALSLALPAAAQKKPAAATGQDAKAIVAAAVATELESNHTDHTAYIYRDHDITPEHDTLFMVIETPQGNLKRKLEDHGHPLSEEERHIDDLRIHGLMNDHNEQAKQKKDAANDDKQAEEMLKLLPVAYIWTIESEKGDLITLNFKPDPAFDPPTLESRVLSAMAGQIVVAKGDNRISTIKGSLVDDVKFVWGLGGRLHKGGSFQVERREIAPHHWQVTESRVHINGKALFFKSIGSQEDEIKTEFKPSPAQTLEQAYEILTSATAPATRPAAK